ncbi:ABC transporter substrate-binding protein [Devosia sp. A449]
MKLKHLLLSAVAVLAITPAMAQEQVIIAHAAGINGASVEEVIAAFEADTGIKAIGVTMSDTDYGAKMQLAARTGNADFDVALGIGSDIYELTRDAGIYAPLDTSGWNADVLAAMQGAGLVGDDYAVSQDTAALMVYSPKLADNPPQSWADFFDTVNWPGNRGLASAGLGVPVNIEYALAADGVAADALYPLDIERAFARLEAISDNIVLWDNAPKGIQDLVNGDTVMTWSYAPAALAAVKNGEDVLLAAPAGTVVTRQLGVAMSKGPNGVAAAQTFLEWWFRPENQVQYTRGTNNGIVVPSPLVLEQFTAEERAYMPFSGEHPENYHTLGYDYYAEQGDLGQSNLALTLDAWNEFRAR